jgi:hypothetical protein
MIFIPTHVNLALVKRRQQSIWFGYRMAETPLYGRKPPKEMRFENEKHIQQSLVFRLRTRVCFEKDANSSFHWGRGLDSRL